MSDWTTEATYLIERTVAGVREKTVEPVQWITRGVVFGLLAALVAIPAMMIAAIGFFRGLVLVEQGYVWAAWFTLAGITFVAGLFLWSKRNP